jgi:S1-C subfamily serine protease
MKRTLYEVLGVGPEASAEEIAAAYRKRLTELEATPSQDQSAMALARDAHDILSDTYLRTNYDASLVRPAAPPPPEEQKQAEDARLTSGRRKLALGVIGVLLVCIAWFVLHRPTPRLAKAPAQMSPAQIAPAQPPAQPTATETEANESAADDQTLRSAKDVFNQVSSSVVRVSVMDASGSKQIDSLSGVVVAPGAVLTNCHAAVRGTTLSVKVGNEWRPATVQIADEQLNLCRLSVPGLDAPQATLGSVWSLRAGQRVLAVGAPLAGEASMRDGIVTALAQVDHGTVIQTNAPITAGWSGGGLFDFSGRLVGIVTFHHPYGASLNVALPIDWAGQMQARGAVTRPQPVASPETESLSSAQISGRWVCFGSIPGRNGVYTFRDDGRVLVTTSEGQPFDSRYVVAKRTLQFDTGSQRTAFNIETFSAAHMVWVQSAADNRVVCDRR